MNDSTVHNKGCTDYNACPIATQAGPPCPLHSFSLPHLHLSLRDALVLLPKLDFHCHLNGSISEDILAHMEQLRVLVNGSDQQEEDSPNICRTGDSLPKGCFFFTNAIQRRQNWFLQRSSLLETKEGQIQNAQGGLHERAPDTAAPLRLQPESFPSAKARMQYCFTVFDNIYAIMNNLAFTRLAVQDLLWNSAAENIFFLEIRTSLRSGLQRTFQRSTCMEHPLEGMNKKDYLQTVIDTVEHVLRGGVVDLKTGELSRTFTQAELLSDAKGTTKSNLAEVDERAGQRAAWWEAFTTIYSGLAKVTIGPVCAASPSEGDAEDSALVRLFSHLHHHMCHRMHVRLLVGINRAESAEAGQESVRLASTLQHEQLRALHAWFRVAKGGKANDGLPYACGGGAGGGDEASRLMGQLMPPNVARRVRTTCWVTGIDLSGNCYKGQIMDFLTLLSCTRVKKTQAVCKDGRGQQQHMGRLSAWSRSMLAVTLHAGEKPDAHELASMIDYHPERWGHLVFTDPTNLRRILAAHDPIELCITSNLLTGGHEAVQQHHLTILLQEQPRLGQDHQWQASQAWEYQAGDNKSATPGNSEDHVAACSRSVGNRITLVEALLDDRCYNHSQRQRLHTRLRRYGLSTPPADAEPLNIPNISIHTDDRGIFSTTLSQELFLLLQHPDVQCPGAETLHRSAGGGVSLTMQQQALGAMWRLQKLAIAQTFELPWPIFLMLLAHAAEAFASPGAVPFLRELLQQPPLHSYMSAFACVSQKVHAVDNWHALREDWVDFEYFIGKLACEEGESPDAVGSGQCFAAVWSYLEWAWLTQCFDMFHIDM